MRVLLTCCYGLLLLALPALAQSSSLKVPRTVEAGVPFSIPTTGSGSAVLYIIGPADAFHRDVQLGETVVFGPDDLHNAGHYSVFLVGGSSTQSAQLDVLPSHQPANLSFLAKPSRLPVDLFGGISGVVYIFDAFRNLIIQPQSVTFELSMAAASPQSRTVTSSEGVAYVKMNSAAKAGLAPFQAKAGSVAEKRIIQQVAGEPCSLKMTARESGPRVFLETDPVRDCSGNPVPDGTIVTFTENYSGNQSTVDVPLKRGVAKTELPAHKGALISVATGVVMGNEIRWNGGQ
jgi:hypothetical protein